VAALASLWATSFACLLINSTFEFVKKDEKVVPHSLMIAPKSDTSFLVLWKLSTTLLESSSKITLFKFCSVAHLIAYKRPIASPSVTSTSGVDQLVLALTNLPAVIPDMYPYANPAAFFEEGSIYIAFKMTFVWLPPKCVVNTLLLYTLSIAAKLRVLPTR